ncbi:MAG: 30S ribosomal protein S19 [archaeon]
MARKEFTYRGKTINELNEMSLEEFAGLLTSRAKKSLKKGFNKQLMKKVAKAKKELTEGKHPKAIRTHKRDTIIMPAMIGLKFAIYRGNSFEIREIEPEMLGHYLGELVLTRKRLMHGKAGIGATRSSTAITARK